MMVMKWIALAVAVLLGFGAGVMAQQRPAAVTMRGIVMDANTLAEEIEYWELRGPSGESIVVTGRKDLPIVKWLRQAKGKPAVMTVDRGEQASVER
jgi:hypothetical protein